MRTILTLVVRLSVKSSALDVEVSVKVRLRNACTADSQAYITRIVAGVGLAHAGGALEREGTRSIFRVRLAHTVCVVLPRAARSTICARTNIASLAFTVVIARVIYLIATRSTVRVAATVARVIATASVVVQNSTKHFVATLPTTAVITGTIAVFVTATFVCITTVTSIRPPVTQIPPCNVLIARLAQACISFQVCDPCTNTSFCSLPRYSAMVQPLEWFAIPFNVASCNLVDQL